MRRFLMIGLVLVFLLSSALGETVVFGDRLKVAHCKEYVTLREEPSSESAALDRVPLNSEVTWLYQDFDGFSYVLFDGQPGYMASRYLEPLPEESVPENIKLLQGVDDYWRPNDEIGYLYTIDVPEYYLIFDKDDGGRTILLPGDEVIMLELGKKHSTVIFEEHQLKVPNEIMKLKNDYRQSPVNLNRTEQYRLNAFFSSLSEVMSLTEYDANEYDYYDEKLIDFALDYLQLNYPELLRPADDDFWAGYTAVIEGGCIQALIDRFFYEEYDDGDAENWYESLYYESIKEYYFVYTGESWDMSRGYNSQVDEVNAIGDSRYAVRFHTHDENGFAIIHAPGGLESSKDWAVECYYRAYARE